MAAGKPDRAEEAAEGLALGQCVDQSGPAGLGGFAVAGGVGPPEIAEALPAVRAACDQNAAITPRSGAVRGIGRAAEQRYTAIGEAVDIGPAAGLADQKVG